LDRKRLNQLFAILLKRLETSINGFDIYFSYHLEDNPKSQVLIFQFLDLNMIRAKIERQEYYNIYELQNDFKLFVHNFMVYRIHGLSPEFESFLRFHFLESCPDSFLNCYTTDGQLIDWFLKMCDRPHHAIYVKKGGMPWWPAKVIQLMASVLSSPSRGGHI
jgi:hypothetical protein